MINTFKITLYQFCIKFKNSHDTSARDQYKLKNNFGIQFKMTLKLSINITGQDRCVMYNKIHKMLCFL